MESLNNIRKRGARPKASADLLQERRTALISAAVTGQIDVRETVKEDGA